MPEYMTKCEPVDKKPYIVYTDEKGILYSGDPDSDIPGGGGGEPVKVYIFNGTEPTEVFPISWVSAINANTNETLTIAADTVTIEGQTGECLSFEAQPGILVHLSVDAGDEGFYMGGSITYMTNFELILPANGQQGDLRYLEFIMPNVPILSNLEYGK